jgi:23S rRNA pseudouridine2605 synthase
MRLNKFLSACGAAARRKAIEYIENGRITVNGERAEQLGMDVSETDDIRLDGRKLELITRFRYVLLNKPAGVVTTASDDRGRKTVVDLVPSRERLFPVGRLDFDTEGVLLLTDDGELAYRLTHPRYEIDKVYEAWVKGLVPWEALEKLKRGVQLEDGPVVKAEAEVIDRAERRSKVRIRIHEGKKRQVKKMMRAVGHPVLTLERTVFAGLTVKGIGLGRFRDLTEEEVAMLYQLTGMVKEP